MWLVILRFVCASSAAAVRLPVPPLGLGSVSWLVIAWFGVVGVASFACSVRGCFSWLLLVLLVLVRCPLLSPPSCLLAWLLSCALVGLLPPVALLALMPWFGLALLSLRWWSSPLALSLLALVRSSSPGLAVVSPSPSVPVSLAALLRLFPLSSARVRGLASWRSSQVGLLVPLARGWLFGPLSLLACLSLSSPVAVASLPCPPLWLALARCAGSRRGVPRVLARSPASRLSFRRARSVFSPCVCLLSARCWLVLN